MPHISLPCRVHLCHEVSNVGALRRRVLSHITYQLFQSIECMLDFAVCRRARTKRPSAPSHSMNVPRETAGAGHLAVGNSPDLNSLPSNNINLAGFCTP